MAAFDPNEFLNTAQQAAQASSLAAQQAAAEAQAAADAAAPALKSAADAAQQAADVATPILKSTADTIIAKSPEVTAAATAAGKGVADFVTAPPTPLEVAGGFASGLFQVTKTGFELAAPAVQEGVRQAVPIVQEGVRQATPVVQEGVRQAAPIVEEGVKFSFKTLQDAASNPEAAAERLRSAASTPTSTLLPDISAVELPDISAVEIPDISSVTLPTTEETLAFLDSPLAKATPYAAGALVAFVVLKRAVEAIKPFVVPTLSAAALLLTLDIANKLGLVQLLSDGSTALGSLGGSLGGSLSGLSGSLSGLSGGGAAVSAGATAGAAAAAKTTAAASDSGGSPLAMLSTAVLGIAVVGGAFVVLGQPPQPGLPTEGDLSEEGAPAAVEAEWDEVKEEGKGEAKAKAAAAKQAAAAVDESLAGLPDAYAAEMANQPSKAMSMADAQAVVGEADEVTGADGEKKKRRWRKLFKRSKD